MLALEWPGASIAPTIDARESRPQPKTGDGATATTETPAVRGPCDSDAGSDSGVVSYRLLAPEAAAEELRLRWAELVEPRGTGRAARRE